MIIRTAEELDIPKIISLLKASLGESLLPKSEAYWKWKHIDNPFGISPVLLAEHDGVLAGVRAFMRWQWSSHSGTLEAVRAVDTATHPDHQGKGIFSKLTTNLLDICKENQWHLVFNTPNDKSLPGYLKMGWKRAGILPMEIKAVRPLSLIFNSLGVDNNFESTKINDSLDYFLRHPGLVDLIRKHRESHTHVFQTPYSPQYLQWRYQKNPVARYYAAAFEKGTALTSLLIYRIKPSKWGNELRIADLLISSPNIQKELRQLVDELISRHHVHFVTFARNNFTLFHGLLHFKTNRLGPIVTVRDIQPGQSDDFMKFKNWNPSLGDMELF